MKKYVTVILLSIITTTTFAQYITRSSPPKCKNYSEYEASLLSQQNLQKQYCVYKNASNIENKLAQRVENSNFYNKDYASSQFKATSEQCLEESEKLKEFLQKFYGVSDIKC